MRAADTNLVVRLVVRDDPKQAEAAEGFVAKGAWISHVVLAEVVWVLRSVYGLTEPDTGKAVQMLLDHEHLVLQQADVVAMALDEFRGHRSVSFTDCLILAIARRAGHGPLGTFDRGLSKIDGVQRV